MKKRNYIVGIIAMGFVLASCSGANKDSKKNIVTQSVEVEASYNEQTGLITSENLVYEVLDNNEEHLMQVFMAEDSEVIEVVIPSTVNYEDEKYKVVAVSENAFDSCNKLEKVRISKGIEEVKNSAFYGCSSLKDVVLPESITNIGEGAFEYCTALEKLKLPSNLKNIGTEAFAECEKLTEINLPGSIVKMGERLFYDCVSLEEITIEDGVSSIAGETFTNCTKLRQVCIPSSVVAIGNEAFWACESLKELTIPEQVKSVGNDCFYTSGIEKLRVETESVVLSEEVFHFTDDLNQILVPKQNIDEYEKILEGRDVEVKEI